MRSGALRIVFVIALVAPYASAAAQAGGGLADPNAAPTPAPGEASSEQAVPDAPTEDGPTAPTSEPARSGLRMLVIDAATFGIDPVVGRVASARMRRTGEELGYEVLGPEPTVAAAQQLRMPYPPTPADLWRVSWIARVHRGAFARIWAHAGQYVIEISVASLDGSGPFFARGTAGANDLREVVDQLLRSALPAPSVWNAAAAEANAQGSGAGPTRESGIASTPDDAIDELDDGERTPRPRPTRREPEPELRRWSLTLQTEGAIGASQQVFYNHLVGLRFDFRITRTILLGAYVAYANLNARDGRASNILFMLQFENRIQISPDVDLTIPLRVSGGYLPFNGPVIRLAAGLNYALSPQWEIGADLLVPTFWILPDRTAVSLDVGLEATYRF